MTELVPGLRVFNRVTHEFSGYQGYDGRAVAELQAGRMVITELCLRQREGGAAVTSERIHEIPVQQIARRSLFTDRRIGEPAVKAVGFGLLEVAERDRLRAAGPTAETVQWAAFFYRVALAVGDPPTKVVRDVFDVSPRTAGLWVEKARRLGFLGESEGRGKASI